MIKKENTWVQVAANGPNVKAGHIHTWRCCLKNTDGENGSGEIPLVDCKISGRAENGNVIFSANSNGGTGMEGVIAWLELYGDIVIQDDVLHITLRDPNDSNP